MIYIILLVIWVSVLSDSRRDGIMRYMYVSVLDLYTAFKNWTPKQWLWHGWKWLSMFLPWILLVYMVFREVGINIYSIIGMLIFTVVCSLTWKIGYNWDKR